MLADAQNRFGDDDRAVDDHAEIDRAQRQQIGGQARQIHEDEGDAQRHRNCRHHHGAARAAEEEDQHDEDQRDALAHRMPDFFDRSVDQLVAVEIGHDPDALRRQLRLQLLQPLMDGAQHLVAFSPLSI